MSSFDDQARLVAVLGPTNTSKTHLAIERMLGHASGMIGFPLRLLARENYDRVVRIKGPRATALVTGEERIVPEHAKYFLCTVESMPIEREVEFLAVDEIQLAADPERGHVFTDRLLRARGRAETMFVGAETVKRILRRLIPELEVITRPRFSVLSYSGPRKITRLPPRSAVVAFSAEEVYAIAELIRRRRGGTAVVLGALSPRTRNAQVDLYQAGEVDFLVATDAIGMGLNMDLAHVSFSGLSKFDGRGFRRLTPAELAQIAGRAGRYLRHGSFGTTGEAAALEPEVVEAIEEHRFEPLRSLMWRSAALDFRSPEALLSSLDQPPPGPELIRAREAEDQTALAALIKNSAITGLADNPAAVRLLWDVAQIPDYRKILSDTHIGMLARIYRSLMANDGRLPEDWTAQQIARIDRTDGDIDTLTQRIAHIRTWTYISHRGGWLADEVHWQERTRSIEDRLSDALHNRLTQRFIDRRATTLMRRLGDERKLVGAVTKTGDVLVEGQHVGRLEGFRFEPADEVIEADKKTLLAAARRALTDDIAGRVAQLEAAPDQSFRLAEDGSITWQDMRVGRLVPGDRILRPGVESLPSDLLEPVLRERLRRRLGRWVETRLSAMFRPLVGIRPAELSGPVRGLMYQLGEYLGTLPRRQVADTVASLTRVERKRVGQLGVRLDRNALYIPALLAPEIISLRGLLWALYHEFDDPPPTPAPGAASVLLDPSLPGSFYLTVGYLVQGDRAVRADRLERLSSKAWNLSRQGPFLATPALAQLIDCTPGEIGMVLSSLGYRMRDKGALATFERAPRGRRRQVSARRRKTLRYDADSPFAKLRELDIAR